MNVEDGYIAFIVNPQSGASSGKRMVSEFNKYLTDTGFDVRTSFTHSLEHACELVTKAAVDYNCSLVIVGGGDGTVRESAHGLEGSDKTLMLIPCGTENLLANELGYDERTKTLIKAFEGNCIRTLDLGSVNGRCFTSIAGFGFDGEVVKRVNDNRTGHLSYLDYFWPLWRTFWSHKFPTIKVAIDGEEIFDGAGMVFVGNISRYAIGLQILHYSNFSDGLLDVCIYKCASRPHLLKHAGVTVLKLHADRKDVIYKQGKSIRISSAERVNTEIDGDPGPPLPIQIEVVPQAVKVLVPPKAKPAGIRTRLIRMIG